MTVAAFATTGSSYPILDGILGIPLFDSILVDYGQAQVQVPHSWSYRDLDFESDDWV
ncbi:membrane anchor subunit of succinate dehydrogenase, Sdh4 [Stygiomarasmius scandens]|uniref:Membrane anchor subunit of succinate dehydrogenase, Sdh4 n=1 Tax=Marasmiellus scandens TaxID=2682957 RepID=A0ABR1K2V8_9AGAR